MRTIPADFRTKAEDYYYKVNRLEVLVAVATAFSVLFVTNVIGPLALRWIAM
jgi:hypothetical protein